MTRSLNFYPRGPQPGNSIELVEILSDFLHFTQRTIYKRLAKHLSMLIFTGSLEIINNNTVYSVIGKHMCIKKIKSELIKYVIIGGPSQ